MSTSKLSLLLNSLSDQQINDFTKTIDSSFYNLSNGAKQTYYYVIKDSRKNGIDRNEINEKVFKLKKTDSQIRKHLSEIFKAIESWIVTINALADQDYKNKVLINHYKTTDTLSLFKTTLQKALKQNITVFNADKLSHRYSLLIAQHEFNVSKSRASATNLQEVLDHLDIEMASKKLRAACAALSHSKVFNVEYDFGTLEVIIDYIRKHNLNNVPSIGIYLHALCMMRQPEDDIHYNSFRNLVKVCEDHFPTHETRSLYLLSINHCVKKINQGHLEFGDEILKLYNTGIDKKYLLLDGHLSRYTYSNVATVSLKLGKSEWAIDFSEKYKPYLRQEEREATYHFNLAKIKYHIGDLDNALISLQYVDFSDHLFSLKAKTLQLKIYYETESYKSLYSHLDAMQMYLLRKKVIGYHKTNYKNLIRYTKLLVKCNKLDRGEKATLKDKVNSEKILTDRKWFLEKLR